MATQSKLYRYLAIQEAYRSVMTDAGRMARGLSRDYIYSEIAMMTHHSRRTIQRALSIKPLSADKIEKR
jgi:hypothetical protein